MDKNDRDAVWMDYYYYIRLETILQFIKSQCNSTNEKIKIYFWILWFWISVEKKNYFLLFVVGVQFVKTDSPLFLLVDDKQSDSVKMKCLFLFQCSDETKVIQFGWLWIGNLKPRWHVKQE